MVRARYEILAIIPARGGSKRLPGKNLLELNGKSLLAYAIDAAKACERISSIVVSTDDDEIAAAARQRDVDVINRPASLAQDDTPIIAVVRHALEYLEKYCESKPLIIVVLQPTSPLRTSGDVEACLDMLLENGADSVLSVSLAQRKEGIEYWSPVAYPENGAVFVSRRAVIMEQHRMVGKNVLAYEMPMETSVDIDTQEDFERAERYLNMEKRGPGRPRKERRA